MRKRRKFGRRKRGGEREARKERQGKSGGDKEARKDVLPTQNYAKDMGGVKEPSGGRRMPQGQRKSNAIQNLISLIVQITGKPTAGNQPGRSRQGRKRRVRDE